MNVRLAGAVLAAGLAFAGGAVAVEPASAPAVAATDGPRFYMLSFTDQPIDEVAEQVLGVALNAPFTIDPSVDGRISFQVDGALSEAELLARFTAALEAEGVRVTRSGPGVTLTEAPPPVVAPAVVAEPPSGGPTRQSAFAGDPPRVATRPTPARTTIPDDDAGRGFLWAGLAIGAGAVLAVLGLVWGFRTRTAKATTPQTAEPEPPPRQQVLDRLLDAYPASPDALAEACVEAARRREPVERALARLGVVPEPALADAYAEASGCRRWRASEAAPLVSDTVDPSLAERLARGRFVLLELGPRLVVATDDPLDDSAVLALAGASGRPVTVRVGVLSEVAAALGERSPAVEPAEPTQAAAEAGARLLSSVLERTAARRRRGTPAARRRA